MIPTSRLPGTVFRSSAECPCTSALGLFTRKYSAGRLKLSPPSNATVNVLRSLCRRNSSGQACGSVINAYLKPKDNKGMGGSAEVRLLSMILGAPQGSITPFYISHLRRLTALLGYIQCLRVVAR